MVWIFTGKKGKNNTATILVILYEKFKDTDVIW